MPSDVTAHVWLWLAVMLVTVLPASAPLMVTATGVFDEVVVPSPNCPHQLAPQQAAVPSDVTAHVWYWLAVMLVTVLLVSAPRPKGIGTDEEACSPQPKRQ